MNDLEWMKTVGGDEPAIPASVLELPKGRRMAVAASRFVFVGVRLAEGQDPNLPPFEDRKAPTGRKVSSLLREWLTSEYAQADVAVAALVAWIDDSSTAIYGHIGGRRFDRGLVDMVLSHAPDAETVTIGFDDGAGLSLVLTWDGFRAVIASAKPEAKAAKDEPFLALPEREVAT